MLAKKVVGDTLYYGVIPKFGLLVNILIMPIITPFLSTEDYGIQGVISSYAGIFVAIAPMGLHIHLTNSYFEYEKNYKLVWGRILFLFLILGLVLGLICMATLFCVLPNMPWYSSFLLCFIGSIQVFFFSNAVLAQNLYPLVQKPKPLVFTNLFASFLGIAVSFVLIYYFRLGFWGLVSSVSISTVFSFLIFGKLVCYDYNIWPIFEHNKRRLKELFVLAIPLIPHALGFALLSSSARIIMSVQKIPYDEIGLFSHGCIMGSYATIITSALGTALALQIQKSYRNNDYMSYRKLYYLSQGISLTFSSLFCIWMPEIYIILIKNLDLRQSASIASIICFANVVLPLYIFMSTTAFIEKKTKQILWLVFIPGFINLMLCILLIPYFGYKIAIYAAIISYWSQMTIPFWVKYYRNTVCAWMGSRNKLFILFFLLLFSLLFSNMVSHCDAVLKIVCSLSIIAVFVTWYMKLKINTISI